MRNGLAGLETQSAAVWEEMAKRLVDANAAGLASRVRRLGEIPGSSRDWPRRLLAELGRLKLVAHAYGRLEKLDPPLQSDLRQTIGWTVGQDELQSQAERVRDDWLIYGQWIDDEDRVQAQHSWMVGRQTGRTALVLQFAPGAAPFAEQIVAGTVQSGTLAFFPGAARQRAKFLQRHRQRRAASPADCPARPRSSISWRRLPRRWPGSRCFPPLAACCTMSRWCPAMRGTSATAKAADCRCWASRPGNCWPYRAATPSILPASGTGVASVRWAWFAKDNIER